MDNFDLRKYLAENKLIKEEMSLEIEDDFIELTADSGTYDAYIEDDGTVDFSVIYEDEDDRDGEEFDEDNWKDILGSNHAFVKISNQIPTKVEAVGDYVMITVDVEDLKGIANLAENKLLKEDISSHKEEAKRFLEKFIDDNKDEFEFIPDLETGYIDAKDNSYNVDELASIFLDIGQDIPRGKYNQKYKGEGGTYVVVAEGKLLKEDMSLTMDELEKLANLKSDEFKSSPKKLVDMVMGSVKFNLEKDGTNIENASEDEIDKLRYKWARLKGLLKVKDTFTSMYGKRGVKTNTDKDLLDKIK